MLDLKLIDSIFILLAIAFIVTTLFRHLTIPAIVGYILVGVLVGPYALGLLNNSQITSDLAEIGIVFLMFMIGLEFSLIKLIQLKRYVFIYGGAQVVLCMLITTMVGASLLEMTLSESFIVGAVIAMSSTAIVIKQLKDQYELKSKHGSMAIAILLFQDLAVIPLFILLPNLDNTTLWALAKEFGWALVNGVGAMILILSIGRWLLKPMLYHIAQIRSLELFTLAALLVTVGTAWITQQMGLSLALGAFLAGMMLAETEFRLQIEAHIRPFQDVFLGFFFISIGTQLDLSIFSIGWIWVLLLVATLLFFKTILITILGLFFADLKDAARTGIVLAEGGEFSFAILSLALTYHLIPNDYGQVILGSILLSMVIAPFLIRFNNELTFFANRKTQQRYIHLPLSVATHTLNNHVIICGYGRIGQHISKFLDKAKIPYVALDLDSQRVNEATLAGFPVCYADAKHYANLEALNIGSAKAVVITFYDTQVTLGILQQIRHYHKQLPIVARSHDEREADLFYKHGATEVIPELLETSLMLASQVLLFMKVPFEQVLHWMDESRKSRYDLLRMIFQDEFLEIGENEIQGLKVITLTDIHAYAVNKSIAELNLAHYHVKITGIRRDSERITDPDSNVRLKLGDIVVLYGQLPNLEKAEAMLLSFSK